VHFVEPLTVFGFTLMKRHKAGNDHWHSDQRHNDNGAQRLGGDKSNLTFDYINFLAKITKLSKTSQLYFLYI
jgi:hypothetical protein